MPFSVSLGCLLFLCLVTGSFSLCIIQSGTNSTCTNSSLVLLPRNNNGLDLTIKELTSVSTNSETTNKNVSVDIMERKGLSYTYNFSENDNTLMIKISGTVSKGLYTITLSLDVSDRDCCNVLATMTHNITLEVIDIPRLWFKQDNPHTLHCHWNSELNLNFLIEFIFNGNTLGYCGEFTTIPMEHKDGITIQYDNSSGECIIKIDEVTSTTEGDYSCSLMIPNPDNSGFLKLYSLPSALSEKKNDEHIYQIVLGLIGGAFLLFGIVSLIIMYRYRKFLKNRCKRNKKSQTNRQERPNNVDDDDELNDHEQLKDNALQQSELRPLLRDPAQQ